MMRSRGQLLLLLLPQLSSSVQRPYLLQIPLRPRLLRLRSRPRILFLQILSPVLSTRLRRTKSLICWVILTTINTPPLNRRRPPFSLATLPLAANQRPPPRPLLL
jgi:hypothetical protein